jgi:hypothetical protein
MNGRLRRENKILGQKFQVIVYRNNFGNKHEIQKTLLPFNYKPQVQVAVDNLTIFLEQK